MAQEADATTPHTCPAPAAHLRTPGWVTGTTASFGLATSAATTAQWLQLLTVGWLVRDLSAGSSSSSLLVVTVGAINTLPGLVVGPWAGVLGDRVNRRKLLMSIQSIMACCAMLFSFLVLSEQVEVWHAYAYVIVSGVCRSFAMPLRQALIANHRPPGSPGQRSGDQRPDHYQQPSGRPPFLAAFSSPPSGFSGTSSWNPPSTS